MKCKDCKYFSTNISNKVDGEWCPMNDEKQEADVNCFVSKNMTFAEHIHSMKDEDFAKFIETQTKSRCEDGACIGAEYCYYHNEDGDTCNLAMLIALQSDYEPAKGEE